MSRTTGEPIGGAATQRRTVALLTALAVAGESGLSRDKLIGLLWPDVGVERARHSLTQALYSARRALGTTELFIVGPEIRLNPALITSDIRDFEAALESGDFQRAIELYRGPFLDGFFVTDSPEFERWSSALREQCQSKVVVALEQLACASEASRDFRSAVEWRKRLAAMTPFDASAAVNLMTALAQSGDRVAALHHAQLYAAVLRQELDLDPDPVVEALAARLKEPVDWSPNDGLPSGAGSPHGGGALPNAAIAPTQPEPTPGEDVTLERSTPAGPTRATPAARSGHHPASAMSPVSIGVWRPVSRSRPWLRVGVIAVLAAVLVGAGVWFGRASRSAAPYQDLALRQRVVVAPFRVVGATGLDYLRDGVVELLSTRLADDTAARSVDAGGVLAAWRASGLSTTAAVPRDTIVALAARLGAERVVVGSIVGNAGKLVIAANVFSIPGGVDLGEASVSGPVDSLTTLIDRLAARLLVAEAGEDERLADHMTTSLPALRAFLAGQAAFRRNEFATALQRYDFALRRDSSFALAALYRALAADELNDEPQLRLAVALAWAGRASLNERDGSVLTAFSGPRYPDASTAEELAVAWQRVLDLGVTSAEAWSVVGSRLLHDGASAGLPNSLARSASAYQRALALNAGYVPAWRALVRLDPTSLDSLIIDASVTDSTAARREIATRITPLIRWRVATVSGDSTALKRFREELPRLGSATLRSMVLGAQFDAIGVDDAVAALGVLRQRATRASDLATLALAEHSLAMNRGRPREALAATSRLRRALPGAHAGLRLRVLDALYADGDSLAAALAARELAELTRTGAPTSSETRLSDACVLAQWRLAHGDTTSIHEAIQALVTAPPLFRLSSAVNPAPNACAILLDVSLAVERRLPNASTQLQRIDSMVFTPQVAGDVIAYAPLLLSRLHERRGDTSSALRALRKRTYMSGWPRYLANSWLTEARLATTLGDTTAANFAYRRFLALRVSPEPALKSEVEAVRSLVEPEHPALDTMTTRALRR